MRQEFRPDIEGLRALAIIPILVFHLRNQACPGGYAGVDIFFVISGFLITRMILGQGASFSFGSFYLRRLFRIFPALIVMLIATMIAGWKLLGPTEYVLLAWSALSAAVGISNLFFLATIDYFNASSSSHPLLHTWSLGVEEQVYLLWPLLLIFARRSSKLPACILSLSVLSLVAGVSLQAAYPEAVFYAMPFRFFEFGLGAGLVVVESALSRMPPMLHRLAGALAAGLLGFSLIFLDSHTPWPSLWTLAPAIATALFIVAGADDLWRRLLSLSPLRALGRISYSLYLVHWPLISLYRSHSISDEGAMEMLVLGGLSIALGAALYVLVEKPLRIRGASDEAGIPTRWQFGATSVPLPSRAVILLSASCALGIGIAATLGARGFPSRLDRARIQLLDRGLTFAGDVCDQRHARCTFGAPAASRVIYVIGDSHALNLVHGLDGLFREIGVRGVALYDHGCLFAFGTKRFLNGVADEKCRRNIEQAYGLLASTRDPVILANDLAGYRHEIGPSSASAPLRHDEAEYFAWLRQRLIEGLSILKPDARTVVVMKQTYMTGVDLPKCLTQPSSGTMSATQRCAPLSRSRVREIYNRADSMIDEIAAHFPAIHVIDPKLLFCETEACATQAADGRLYFRDTAHLTNEGSDYVVGKARDQLLSALLRK